MWSSWSKVTRFSIVVFFVSGVLGLLSMGALGYGLYYLVIPILGNRIDELQGDSLWPSMILAGMAWSQSFLFASFVHHALKKHIASEWIMKVIYGFVLWTWILVVWFTIIHFRVVS